VIFPFQGLMPQHFQLSAIRCQVSGVGCRVSGIGCQVSGVRYRVSGIGCQVSGIGCRLNPARVPAPTSNVPVAKCARPQMCPVAQPLPRSQSESLMQSNLERTEKPPASGTYRVFRAAGFR